MERLLRGDLVGREVYDSEGLAIGTVAGVWPDDGGGHPEMVLIGLGRFSLRRYVPVEGTLLVGEGALTLPWTLQDVDAAPDAENHGWGDPATVARAHWLLYGDG